MADIMEEIFGDMLFKAQRDEESHLLPSPNQLKHKILIKVKFNLYITVDTVLILLYTCP